MDKLKSLVNDDDLYEYALMKSTRNKPNMYKLTNKTNIIYNLPYVNLYAGLNYINECVKKSNNNKMTIIDNPNDSHIIKKLKEYLQYDNNQTLIINLMILQLQKEADIDYKKEYIFDIETEISK